MALEGLLFGSALVSLAAVLRIVYILSTNPIGEFAQELVYLRIRELRQPGILVFVVLLLELAEHLLPFLVRRGLLSPAPDFALFVNAAQAVLVAAAAIAIVLVVRRYTHRALDRRIRESMETLAYLEGQRRRRRSLERGEWDARDEE